MTWIGYQIAIFYIDEIYGWIWAVLICWFERISCKKSFQISNITSVSVWARSPLLKWSYVFKFILPNLYYQLFYIPLDFESSNLNLTIRRFPKSVFLFGFYSKVPQPIISICISKLGSIHNEDKLSFHCVILYYKELLNLIPALKRKPIS